MNRVLLWFGVVGLAIAPAAAQQALGVVDRVIEEPLGGAHRDPDAAIGALKGAIIEELDGCSKLSPNKLKEQRRAKFLAIG